MKNRVTCPMTPGYNQQSPECGKCCRTNQLVSSKNKQQFLKWGDLLIKRGCRYITHKPYFILIFFNVYLFLIDRSWAGEGQKERETQNTNRLPALNCQHRARCRAWTHEPWDYDLSRSQILNRLSHPGIPTNLILATDFVKQIRKLYKYQVTLRKPVDFVPCDNVILIFFFFKRDCVC